MSFSCTVSLRKELEDMLEAQMQVTQMVKEESKKLAQKFEDEAKKYRYVYCTFIISYKRILKAGYLTIFQFKFLKGKSKMKIWYVTENNFPMI